jgi:hypothetical protein
VRAFPRIYVCGDGDDPGRRFNDRIRRDLPWARAVELPVGEDVRSLVQRDPGLLLECLAAADAVTRLDVGIRVADDVDELEAILRDPCLLAAAAERGLA